MSTNPTTKPQPQPPGGLFWPHEWIILGLLVVSIWLSDERTSALPGFLYALSLVGALVAVAWRCRREWRVLPAKWLFVGLLAAWVALFAWLGNTNLGYGIPPSLFSWLFNGYTSEMTDEKHGLLIPFVVLALYWWKRRELVAEPPSLWWPGMLLIVLGLLLHLAGFVAQQTRLSVLGFLAGLYGLMGLLWGRHWFKAGFFPFFLFVFCIPVGELADGLTLPLRLLVTHIVEWVGRLGLAPDLVRQGTLLFDAQRTFEYEVAPACSGIHSLVALLSLATIYGFMNFRTPWKRGVMMLAAIPLAVLGNVVRLCFTIGVAEMFGQNAGKRVETDFGFVTFAVAFGCAYLLGRWLEKSEPPVVLPLVSPAT